MMQGDVVDLGHRTGIGALRPGEPLSLLHPGGPWPQRILARWSIDRIVRTEVLSVVSLVLIWLVLGRAVEGLSFSTVASESIVAGIALFSALARLFAAFVLFLLPAPTGQSRVRWVGIGFLTLGLGQLGFGFLYPALSGRFDANRSLYASAVVWSIAGVCFVSGLLPRTAPEVSMRRVLPLAIGAAIAIAIISLLPSRLPLLIGETALQTTDASRAHSASVLTHWYWVFALTPAALAALAAVGSVIRCPGIAPSGWLAVTISLIAGSQLHNAFWPSTYTSVLTSTSVLQISFSLLVAVGGAFELRRIAAEREQAISARKEYAERLTELSARRADFTTMVTHEIGSPLAAIRAYADILDQGYLDQTMKHEAIATIRNQLDHIRNLIHDVETIATIECDQFAVNPFSVPLNVVLADSAAFATSLTGNHPINCPLTWQKRVVVDPVRIAQVLHNLLSNAAKYSPPGTPIDLRACRVGQRMRIEVEDRGYGIPPEDLDCIFEKYCRGGAEYSRTVSGRGLGLYISRRIVEAHGSQLDVSSTPGSGSVFGFEVEVAE